MFHIYQGKIFETKTEKFPTTYSSVETNPKMQPNAKTQNTEVQHHAKLLKFETASFFRLEKVVIPRHDT